MPLVSTVFKVSQMQITNLVLDLIQLAGMMVMAIYGSLAVMVRMVLDLVMVI